MQANVAIKPTEERIVSGWIIDKGVVLPTNPDSPKILYGEAIDSEDEASRRRGRRGADLDALRLYYRIYDMFPASPLAGEALYRAADIRWQLEKADIMTKPSAQEQDAYLRGEIDPEWMKLVMKKFPGTKWADLAAFTVLDNKMCGDWKGASRCPEKEADIYEKFANEHPQSAKAPEALYDAAWRYSALIEIYKSEDTPKKSDEAKAKALNLAQKVASQYPDSDWGARALRLVFLLQQMCPRGETTFNRITSDSSHCSLIMLVLVLRGRGALLRWAADGGCPEVILGRWRELARLSAVGDSGGHRRAY